LQLVYHEQNENQAQYILYVHKIQDLQLKMWHQGYHTIKQFMVIEKIVNPCREEEEAEEDNDAKGNTISLNITCRDI
jgi:hypothetical protein